MTPLYIMTILLSDPKESILLFTNSSSPNLGASSFLILHSQSAVKACWLDHLNSLLSGPHCPPSSVSRAALKFSFPVCWATQHIPQSWIQFPTPPQSLKPSMIYPFYECTAALICPKVSYAKFWLAIFSLKYLVEKIQPQIINHVNIPSKYF